MSGRKLWGGGRIALAVGLCFCLLLLHGCARKTAAKSESARTFAENLKRLDAPARPEERVADDDRSPAQPDAPALTIDSPVLRSGAKLTGTLTAALKKGIYRLLWIDGAGRVVAASELDERQTSGATVPFAFTYPAGCVGERHTIVLVRCAKGKPDKNGQFEAIAKTNFRAARSASPWNDYLVVCDGICENGNPDFVKNLRQAGINTLLQEALDDGGVQSFATIGKVIPGGQQHPFKTAPWMDGATPYSRSRNANDLVRHPPLFDESALAAVKTAIQASVASKNGEMPVAWSLGEGLALTDNSSPLDLDMSPETLAIFQAWLEEKHGSIGNLNARWGTHFENWQRVQPPTTDNVKAAHNPLYAQRLAELIPPPGSSISGSSSVVADGKKFELRGKVAGFILKSDELRAPGGENFAAWADWREFNAFAFGRVMREYRAQLRSALSGTSEIPAAGVRGMGAPSIWSGWDCTQLSKTLEWAECDSPLARELVRSFPSLDSPASKTARSTRLLSPFTPASNANVYQLWDNWLRGDAGCFVKQPELWATTDAPGKEQAQAYLSELPLLTQGLTRLRDGARRISDPIAIYYSPRSMALHWMLDSEADGAFWLKRSAAYEAAHSSALLQLEAWQSILDDLGYAPRFVQPQQLLAGDLRKNRVKVLILPKVLSLSDEEARAIREFAKSGGIVIADGECGTFDGAGRRDVPKNGAEGRTLGALDKDFGIARRDFHVLELNGEFHDTGVQPRVNLRSADDAAPAGPSSPELRVLEPGIVPSGARWHAASEGGAPALLVKPSGAGRFVYLNLALQDYVKLSENPAAPDFQFSSMSAPQYAAKYGAPRGGEALRLVLGDLLAEAVAENPLKVRYEDGTPVRGIRRVRFALGKGAWLFGLLPRGRIETSTHNKEGDGGGETTLVRGMNESALPDVALAWNMPRHWYDITTGTYLGEGFAVRTGLDLHRAALIAALPYRVEKIGVKMRRTDPAGGFKFTASVVTSGGDPGLHVFHAEIYDPQGQRLAHYSQNVSAENGTWSGEIHLAINEPAGTYRLVIRDIVSGVSAESALLKDSAQYIDLK